MPRSSKVHYIAPSAISILPNANGTSSDLAVYVARGTKIKVYSPAAGIDMEDATYQEWSLRGRNRHLAEDSKPYTIYARLSKTMKEDGYLVFAPQKKNAVSGKWGDKYSSVTTDGLSQITRNDGTKARVADPDYWYVRLGEVSLPDGNDKRTVDLDTGIVGTDQYNMDWALNPDNPELHVELDCRIDSKDAGQSPIVPLGKALVLTSLLKGKASIVDTLDHWTIERSTGDDKSDASWPDATRASSFARTGIITLAHDKEEGDDFNGTVVAVFTVRAWGRPEEEAAGTRAGGSGTGTGTGTTEYVELASERISVMTQAGNQFLSRLVDDAAQGIITFMRGLKSVGDIIASVIKSDNYTGTGMADTGYLVTDNWNDSGSSGAVFDYLTIRKKMIINSLEIKETHFSAGDLAQSCANAELARTDYYQVTVDGQGNETYTLLGYSEVRVPWVLRGIMAVRQKLFPGASKKVPSALGHWKKVRMTLTMEQLKKVNRVRCYFLAKDGERNVENWWRTNDLARCQTWNVEQSKRETFAPDFDNHMGNIYWWRKVMKVSQNTGEQRYVVKDSAGDPVPYDPKDINTYTTSPSSTKAWKNEVGNAHLATNGEYRDTVDADRKPAEIDGKTYHWFDVAYDYEREKDNKVHEWCDAMSDIPAAGDKVVQFGNTEDPDRMNVTVSEVNGSGNVDAPDIKIYRGIYSFSLQKSWWGGKPCKMKLSPSTGYEFYGPHFRFTTEYGKARPTMDRGLWTKIGFERDEYNDGNRPDSYTGPTYSDDKNGKRADGSSKSKVRKCYYYDRVSHKGSLWLCTMANELWYWRATETFTQDGTTYNAGDKLSDSQFTSLTDENRNKCEHVRNYTNEEPSATSLVWTKQVSQGGFKSRAFCRTNTDISTYVPEGGTSASPIPTKMKNPATGQYVSGITWYDGAPSADASGNKNAILWSTTAWFFEGDEKPEWSLPTPETDTQTQDIEFSPSREKPADPVGTAANKDTSDIKDQRHQQGWYDPKDTLPSGTTWEDMVWRAERQIANGVYSGEWEISRIKGESANRLDLDNEMDMIQTSSARKITAERTVETVVHLYEGAGEVDLSSVSFGTSGDARISGGPAAAVADFSQESEGTGKKGRRLKWKFKAGQVMDATYSIHVTYKYLNVDYDGVFTVAASMGQPICQLKPGLSALPCRRDEDTNSLEAPPTLPLEVLFVDGSSSATIDTFSNGTVSYNGKTYHVRYSLSAMPSGKTAGTAWPQAGVSASSTDENVYIAVFNDGGTLLDRETVPVVKDGQHGDGIKSITRKYNISKNSTSTNDSTAPTDCKYNEWQTNSPSVEKDYPNLWCEETVTYNYKTATRKYYFMGRMGDHGIDAKDAEWAYIRTKTAVPPVISNDGGQTPYTDHNGKTYTSDDHLPRVEARADIESNNSGDANKPYECTDDPKGVDGTYKYEWEIKRTKGAQKADNSRDWLPYSGTMTLHNNLAESALTIDIDNDTDQFGVDADGKVLVQQTCSTVVSMLYGTAEQTFIDPDDNNHPEPRIALKYDDGTSVDTSVAEASVAAVPNTGNKEYRVTVTVKQTGSGVTPVFGKTGKNGLYVDISGTCSLGTKAIRFTLQKVMSGKAGENPVIYRLNPSVKCFSFKRNNNNGLTPTAISSYINVLETVGNSTTEHKSAMTGVTYSWGWDVDAAAQETGKAVGTYISVGSGQTDDHYQVWVQLYNNGVAGDRETLPIVKDGEHGVSPWQADLSNEMDSIHVTDLGTASSSQGVYTFVSLFKGSSLQNFTINSVERYYIDGNGVRQTIHTYTQSGASDNVTVNFMPASGGKRSVTVNYAAGAQMHGRDLYDITISPDGSTPFTLTFTIVATTGDRYEVVPMVNGKAESAIRAERKDDNTLVIAGSDPPTDEFTLGCRYNITRGGGGSGGRNTVPGDGSVSGGYYAVYRLRTASNSAWGGYSLLASQDPSDLVAAVTIDDINTYDAVEVVICSDTSSDAAVENTVIDRETLYVVADGRKGDDGKSVTNTNIYYTAAASQPGTPSGAPGGSGASGWVDDGNSLITSGNAALHLYESTCTTYSDGTYSWTTPLDDGLISDMASTSEEFALADSGTTAPTTGWGASVTPTAGKWIWSRTKLTFKNGSESYVNTQCVGYCGTDGDNAVVYALSCADVVKPGDTALSVNVIRTDGDTSEEKAFYAAKTSWRVLLDVSFSGCTGSKDEEHSLVRMSGITGSSKITLTLKIGSEVKDKKVVRGVADGQSGEPGHVGRWYYDAGEWISVYYPDGVTPRYVMEPTQAPYVRVTVNGNTHFYMLDFNGYPSYQNDGQNHGATTEPLNDSYDNWRLEWTEVHSTFKYFMTEVTFAENAYLGSFIINGDWMISQWGDYWYGDRSEYPDVINTQEIYDQWVSDNGRPPYSAFLPVYVNTGYVENASHFCPYFAVDGRAGKVYMNDAYVRGQIVATGGEIDGQMIVGNSGSNHIKIQPMDGYGAAVEGYTGDDKKFSLGFFGGNPCLYVGNSFYGERTVKLTDSSGSYAQLIMGYGGIPQVMLYHNGTGKKIIIDLDSQGVARIIADSWPTGRNSVGVGGVYMEPSSRVLMVRDS